MAPSLGPDTRLSAVLFDLDGTLVDTMPAFADLAAQVMEAWHGLGFALARRRYLETSGLPFVQQLELISPGHAANAAASAEFEARKLAVCRRTSMDARTIAGLEALRGLGLALVVSSNTGQDVVDEFAACEPLRFDLALGFDPARGLAKGLPHIERTLAALGIARERLLFVGDSLRDADLAEQAGIPFVGRVGTFSAGDFRGRDPNAITVGHVDELPDLVRAHVHRT
jgi:phosphoglycolate phosphatase-like HAD superfamily hydrolase